MLKQASSWHGCCSRNAPQYGVPSRAISVARVVSQDGKVTHSLRHFVQPVTHKLRTVYEMRDIQCHECALNSFVVTSRDTMEKIYEYFKIFVTTWYALHLTHIATHPHAHCHEFFPHRHATLRVTA